MAARKSATRTSRKAKPAAGRLDALRANAAGAVATLMAQGHTLQSNGRKLAIAKVKAARAAVMGARKAVTARAGEARVRTVDAVNALEKVFEVRVSRAISRLGVPTSRDVRALSRQVTQLQQSVDQLRRTRARA